MRSYEKQRKNHWKNTILSPVFLNKLKGVKKNTDLKMAFTQSIFPVHKFYTYDWKRNSIKFSDHTS